MGAAWAPFGTLDFSAHIAAVMAAKPDAIFSTPWAGEAVMLLRQAQIQGVFDQVKLWWQAMGGSVDVLEGIAPAVKEDKFHGKLWATARYIHNWPDTPENKAFVERFQKRWSRLPNYSAETTYSAVMIAKTAIEKARSLDSDKPCSCWRSTMPGSGRQSMKAGAPCGSGSPRSDSFSGAFPPFSACLSSRSLSSRLSRLFTWRSAASSPRIHRLRSCSLSQCSRS